VLTLNESPLWMPAFAGMTKRKVLISLFNKVSGRGFEWATVTMNPSTPISYLITLPLYATA